MKFHPFIGKKKITVTNKVVTECYSKINQQQTNYS